MPAIWSEPRAFPPFPPPEGGEDLFRPSDRQPREPPVVPFGYPVYFARQLSKRGLQLTSAKTVIVKLERRAVPPLHMKQVVADVISVEPISTADFRHQYIELERGDFFGTDIGVAFLIGRSLRIHGPPGYFRRFLLKVCANLFLQRILVMDRRFLKIDYYFRRSRLVPAVCGQDRFNHLIILLRIDKERCENRNETICHRHADQRNHRVTAKKLDYRKSTEHTEVINQNYSAVMVPGGIAQG